MRFVYWRALAVREIGGVKAAYIAQRRNPSFAMSVR